MIDCTLHRLCRLRRSKRFESRFEALGYDGPGHLLPTDYRRRRWGLAGRLTDRQRARKIPPQRRPGRNWRWVIALQRELPQFVICQVPRLRSQPKACDVANESPGHAVCNPVGRWS